MRYCTCGHANELHKTTGGIIAPCVVDGCDCDDMHMPNRPKPTCRIEVGE